MIEVSVLFCSYDNLVVGCPLCSEEQGMVYYYGNVNGSLGNVILKILAPNTNQKGRFGISVENIGDLDKDGYQGKTDRSDCKETKQFDLSW